MTEQERIEYLADKEHDSWSNWMKWLFKCSVSNEDGTITIPKDKIVQWQRQMNTPYSELSEPEKEADRKEIQHILLLESALEAQVADMHSRLKEAVEKVAGKIPAYTVPPGTSDYPGSTMYGLTMALNIFLDAFPELEKRNE